MILLVTASLEGGDVSNHLHHIGDVKRHLRLWYKIKNLTTALNVKQMKSFMFPDKFDSSCTK
jgi:hypothetical protein